MVALLLAVGIWCVLVGLAALAGVALISRGGAGHLTPIDPQPLLDQSRELGRYAEEVGVAAQRAAAMAGRRRDEWLAAQAQAEAAWRMFADADNAAGRLESASAYPVPSAEETPDDGARYLRRAAMSACSRRQMSALELSDVLAHRNGWDPSLHPVEQELVLQRAIRDGLLSTYRTAAARERDAWQASDLAAVASASLRDEAFEAAGRVRRVRFAARVAQLELARHHAAPVILRRLRLTA